jgi:hypothetical protein
MGYQQWNITFERNNAKSFSCFLIGNKMDIQSCSKAPTVFELNLCSFIWY